MSVRGRWPSDAHGEPTWTGGSNSDRPGHRRRPWRGWRAAGPDWHREQIAVRRRRYDTSRRRQGGQARPRAHATLVRRGPPLGPGRRDASSAPEGAAEVRPPAPHPGRGSRCARSNAPADHGMTARRRHRSRRTRWAADADRTWLRHGSSVRSTMPPCVPRRLSRPVWTRCRSGDCPRQTAVNDRRRSPVLGVRAAPTCCPGRPVGVRMRGCPGGRPIPTAVIRDRPFRRRRSAARSTHQSGHRTRRFSRGVPCPSPGCAGPPSA